MQMFISEKTGRYLYYYEVWKTRGRGKDKVIEEVKHRFAFEGEIPEGAIHPRQFQMADHHKAAQFVEKWGNKMGTSIRQIQVAIGICGVEPWFSDIP